MALTATATKGTRQQIMKVLGMTASTCTVINISPEKYNIYLTAKEKVSIENYVERVSAVLIRDGILSKKLLIFCRTYEDCYQFYRGFKSKLGSKFTIPESAPNLPQFRMVDMYTRCTQIVVKDHIVSEFSKPDGRLRVVIATIAFGMGVDCPNITCVVHWGPSETVEDYVQEIGRAGRDRQPVSALLFFTPCDKAHAEKSMIEYSTKHEKCKRAQLFQQFDSFTLNNSSVSGCRCCFVCAHTCKCGYCNTYVSAFEYL